MSKVEFVQNPIRMRRTRIDICQSCRFGHSFSGEWGSWDLQVSSSCKKVVYRKFFFFLFCNISNQIIFYFIQIYKWTSTTYELIFIEPDTRKNWRHIINGVRKKNLILFSEIIFPNSNHSKEKHQLKQEKLHDQLSMGGGQTWP